MNIGGFSNELSRRYDDVVEAGNSQRQRERQATENFSAQVYNDMSMEEVAPPPPNPSAEDSDEQFDPAMDERANDTKNYLIQKSKNRMDRVVAPQD